MTQNFAVAYIALWMVTVDQTLLIYNADFDIRHLDVACQTIDQHLLGKDVEGKGLDQCVMHVYAAFVGNWDDYYQAYRFQRLPNGGHSALADCRATLQLIKDMAAARLPLESHKTGDRYDHHK